MRPENELPDTRRTDEPLQAAPADPHVRLPVTPERARLGSVTADDRILRAEGRFDEQPDPVPIATEEEWRALVRTLDELQTYRVAVPRGCRSAGATPGSVSRLLAPGSGLAVHSITSG